ncbi:MAG TPA: patatin-like phospholipase family protein [Gemmataceae bacterium]|nr:patatin-like phospholipase family protein [Gemmataceae bacterium]
MRSIGIALVAVAVMALGCSHPPPRKSDAIGPLTVTDLMDAQPTGDTVSVLSVRPTLPKDTEPADSGRPPFHVLVLSGGGADGAYSVGALVGWSDTGTRPKFDVVTGVSTGALIGTLVYLGRDTDLQRFYTTVSNSDLFDRRSTLSALLSDALADPAPLAKQIAAMVDERFLEAVAAEHRKGRRLYVGTTHLDARRLVVWDMGEIAARGTPEDVVLFRRVLLASAAAPGFFPPIPIPVEVDGKTYEELHVDGGATASLFFRPPQVPWTEAVQLGDRPLVGSHVYVMVAGKLYAEPDRVERRLLSVVTDSVVALVAAQCRSDLVALHAFARESGMNYHLSAIPPGVRASPDPMSFDPKWMNRLFEAGRRRAKDGGLWRTTPPGSGPGEEVPDRTGTRLMTGSPAREAADR